MIPDPPSRLDAAKRILGKRWGEDRARGCYSLDGRPCSAMDLLRAAGMGDVPRTIEQAQDEGV